MGYDIEDPTEKAQRMTGDFFDCQYKSNDEEESGYVIQNGVCSKDKPMGGCIMSKKTEIYNDEDEGDEGYSYGDKCYHRGCFPIALGA